MTTLTLYSTLFSIFSTGVPAQRRHRGAVHGRRRAQQSCHRRESDRHVMRLRHIHRRRHREHSENYFLMYASTHCSEHSPPPSAAIPTAAATCCESSARRI